MPSKLSPALASTLDVLGLLDPTTMSTAEQDKAVGAVVAGTAVLFPVLYTLNFKLGFVPDVAVSLLVGSGSSGYLSLRKDIVGRFARDVAGDTANKALLNLVRRSEELAEEYDVLKASQERVGRQVELLTSLQKKATGPIATRFSPDADARSDATGWAAASKPQGEAVESREELYEKLDSYIDREDYDAARLIKQRLDQLEGRA